MVDLSPALELAVRMITAGESLPAYLCDDIPTSVADIGRCQMGSGEVSAEGGLIKADREGRAVCIAYDVQGQLVTSQTAAMPLLVRKDVLARVGPLAFGTEGVPHRGT